MSRFNRSIGNLLVPSDIHDEKKLGFVRQLDGLSSILQTFTASELIRFLMVTDFEIRTLGNVTQTGYETAITRLNNLPSTEEKATMPPSSSSSMSSHSESKRSDQLPSPYVTWDPHDNIDPFTEPEHPGESKNPVNTAGRTKLRLNHSRLVPSFSTTLVAGAITAGIQTGRFHREYFNNHIQLAQLRSFDLNDPIDRFIHQGFVVIWNNFLNGIIPWRYSEAAWNTMSEGYKLFDKTAWEQSEAYVMQHVSSDRLEEVYRSSAIQRTLFRLMGNINRITNNDFSSDADSFVYCARVLKDCEYLPVPPHFIRYVQGLATDYLDKIKQLTSSSKMSSPVFRIDDVMNIINNRRPTNLNAVTLLVAVLCMEDHNFYKGLLKLYGVNSGYSARLVHPDDKIRESVMGALLSYDPAVSEAALGYLYYRITVYNPGSFTTISPVLFA